MKTVAPTSDGVNPPHAAMSMNDPEALANQRITIEMLRMLDVGELSALKAELKAAQREIVRQINENRHLPPDERRDLDWERAARMAGRHRERALNLIAAVNRERGEQQRLEAEERRRAAQQQHAKRNIGPVADCVAALGHSIGLLRAAGDLHAAAAAFLDDDSDDRFEELDRATRAFSAAIGGLA